MAQTVKYEIAATIRAGKTLDGKGIKVPNTREIATAVRAVIDELCYEKNEEPSTWGHVKITTRVSLLENTK